MLRDEKWQEEDELMLRDRKVYGQETKSRDNPAIP